MYVLQCGCYMLDNLYRLRFWQRTTLLHNVPKRLPIYIIHNIIRCIILTKNIMYLYYVRMMKRRDCLGFFYEFIEEFLDKRFVRLCSLCYRTGSIFTFTELLEKEFFYCYLTVENILRGKVGYSESTLSQDFFYFVFSSLEECSLF